uniref:Uncharacterized protein n=1 Tax=uncultured marine virus TaxID=186617 RepID=A0A0F7L7C1_9VIRU|nr:hypothetical protein [uncultured marine virus]
MSPSMYIFFISLFSVCPSRFYQCYIHRRVGIGNLTTYQPWLVSHRRVDLVPLRVPQGN